MEQAQAKNANLVVSPEETRLLETKLNERNANKVDNLAAEKLVTAVAAR